VWALTFRHQILAYKTVLLTEVKQGVLPEGGRMIAVKRLAENAPVPSGITFETEVTNLMALKHQNIVELVHYCHESQKKVVQHNGRYVIVDVIESCLCYRYLPKGSLDNYLLYGMQCTIQHSSPLSMCTIHT
jgi:disease resistance protein RPM1